jgi:hypothetical protein
MFFFSFDVTGSCLPLVGGGCLRRRVVAYVYGCSFVHLVTRNEILSAQVIRGETASIRFLA